MSLFCLGLFLGDVCCHECQSASLGRFEVAMPKDDLLKAKNGHIVLLPVGKVVT